MPVPGFAPAKTKPCDACPFPGCQPGQYWKCDNGTCSICCTPGKTADCKYDDKSCDGVCQNGGGGNCPTGGLSSPDDKNCCRTTGCIGNKVNCSQGLNWRCSNGSCELCCPPNDKKDPACIYDGSSCGDGCAAGATCPGTPACSGHGTCKPDGKCHPCDTGWSGNDCNTPVCPGGGDCSGHGTCKPDGKCDPCDTGWSGNDCSVPQTGPACPGDGTCSGNGVCSGGDCACHSNWSGADCSVYRGTDEDKKGGSSGIIIFLSVIAGIIFLVIIGMIVFLFISSRKKPGAPGAAGAPAPRRPRKTETVYY